MISPAILLSGWRLYVPSENGLPLAKGRVVFYLSHTSERAAVYKDKDMAVSHGSVVAIPNDGILPEIWLDRKKRYSASVQKRIGTTGDESKDFLELWHVDDLNDFYSEEEIKIESSVAFVKSINELRSLQPAQYDMVVVTGYYSNGDCSPMLFRWSTNTIADDNGGSHIMPATMSATSHGRWVQSASGLQDAAHWGVLPSENDNVSHIVQAMSWANSPLANKDGKPRLTFSVPGTYRLSGSLTFTCDTRVSSGVKFATIPETDYATVTFQGDTVIDSDEEITADWSIIKFVEGSIPEIRPQWWHVSTKAIGGCLSRMIGDLGRESRIPVHLFGDFSSWDMKLTRGYNLYNMPLRIGAGVKLTLADESWLTMRTDNLVVDGDHWAFDVDDSSNCGVSFPKTKDSWFGLGLDSTTVATTNDARLRVALMASSAVLGNLGTYKFSTIAPSSATEVEFIHAIEPIEGATVSNIRIVGGVAWAAANGILSTLNQKQELGWFTSAVPDADRLKNILSSHAYSCVDCSGFFGDSSIIDLGSVSGTSRAEIKNLMVKTVSLSYGGELTLEGLTSMGDPMKPVSPTAITASKLTVLNSTFRGPVALNSTSKLSISGSTFTATNSDERVAVMANPFYVTGNIFYNMALQLKVNGNQGVVRENTFHRSLSGTNWDAGVELDPIAVGSILGGIAIIGNRMTGGVDDGWDHYSVWESNLDNGSWAPVGHRLVVKDNLTNYVINNVQTSGSIVYDSPVFDSSTYGKTITGHGNDWPITSGEKMDGGPNDGKHVPGTAATPFGFWCYWVGFTSSVNESSVAIRDMVSADINAWYPKHVLVLKGVTQPFNHWDWSFEGITVGRQITAGGVDGSAPGYYPVLNVAATSCLVRPTIYPSAGGVQGNTAVSVEGMEGYTQARYPVAWTGTYTAECSVGFRLKLSFEEFC